MSLRAGGLLTRLAIIDVMMLPYIKPFPILITMVPVLFWNLQNTTKIISRKDGCLSVIVIFFVCLSVTLSLIFFSEYSHGAGISLDVAKKNVIRSSLIVLFFMYYLFFSFNLPKYAINIKKYLVSYILFSVALAIVYFIDHNLYFDVRSFWAYEDDVVRYEKLENFVRFLGILSDPNNAATVFVAIISYLCINIRQSSTVFILLVLGMVCVISTMSTTGLLEGIISLFVVTYVRITDSSGKRPVLSVTSAKYILLILVLVSGALYVIPLTDIGELAIGRALSSSAESRLQKFTYLTSMDWIGWVMIGYGGTIVNSGDTFSPHIGHLHMLLNYGLLVYTLFLYVVFRVRRCVPKLQYLPIFILFLGFTANTGFIEFRFTAASALLLAAYATSNYRRSGANDNESRWPNVIIR